MSERNERRATLALTILAMAGAGLAWAAKAHPAQVLAPLSERVTALEAHRASDKEKIDGIDKKVDFLIERLVR